MMKTHQYLVNIITIFQMSVNMILILCNIASRFISSTWWSISIARNGILYGQMGVLHNSKAQSLDIL
jgi:hypothetical protein